MNEVTSILLKNITQYSNYSLIQQISIYLGVFAQIIVYINILLFFALSIAKRIISITFKIGCIAGFLGFFIVTPFLYSYYTVYYKRFENWIFLNVISKEQIFNFTTESYYFAIPLYSIISVFLVWLTIKHYKNQMKAISGVKGISKNTKKLIKKIEKNPEALVFSSKPTKTIISNIFRGILIHGGAGSGKSKTFIYPILDQMINKNFTGIVYDFKSPELIEFIKSIHTEENKIKLIEINFKTPGTSERINLLDGLQNISEVKELSSTLWKNLNNEAIKKKDFWNSSSENLLTATMYVLIRKFPRYATVPHALAVILSYSPEELINFISVDRQASGLIKSMASANELGADKQVSGTLGTLQNFISNLATPEIFWLLSGSKMPTPNSIENPSIFLLGNESTMYETYSPVIAMIITAIIRKMNRPNMLKSMVVLDELPTLFIPSLETLPATSRSNKIATIVGVQDMSQLIDKYGKEKADIILSNLGTQFFGRSTLEKTATYVSKLFGKFDKMMLSTTKGSSSSFNNSTSNRGTTTSYQERDRIKPQDILNMKAGQFCGTIAEGYPKEFIKQQFNEYVAKPIKQKKEEVLFNQIIIKKETSYAQMEQNFEDIYKQVEQFKTS